MIAWTGMVQACAAEESLRQNDLTTWTTDQGLPQNFIRSIAQTSDGFLWAGTMSGLARFDGLHFRGFGKDGSPDLQGNIAGLAPDAGGGLWVATATGLLHYQNRRFEPISMPGRAHYRVDAMARCRDGEVWIYGEGKLARSRNNQLEFVESPSDAHPLRDIAEGADRTLWIADGEAVFAVAHNAKVVRYALSGARMVYTDDFGDVFAGDGHGLFRFDGKDFRRVSNPGLGNFVGILVDHQRRLWMASGGLHGVSRKSEARTEILTTAGGLASDDVRSVFEDRNRDIWLGTIAGLQRLHQGIFTTYSAVLGLSHGRSQLDSVFQQKDGRIWVGSLEGGVAEWTNGQWHRYGRAEGLPPGQVRGFAEDGEKPAIAISDYGIFVFRRGKFSRLSSIPAGYINAPVRTPDGALWFSVPHRGLYQYKEGRVTHFGENEGVPDDSIWSLAMDAGGDIWVGSGNQLLRWSQFRFQEVLTSPSPILCMLWPRHESLVLGTLNGLLFHSANGDRLLTQKDGLPGDTVLDVVGDGQDNLWIATTRAIARISHAEWTAYANGKAEHVDPVVYTGVDGLKSNTVLPLNQVSALRAQDGRIWFPTARGLSVVDPNLAPEPAVQAVIDSVVVDDREQAFGPLIVAPGQHRITFTYTTPPTVAVEQFRFRYRLTGWDRNWVDAGTARAVSYTGLTPGSYVIEVIAVNREGVSSASSAVTTLRLRPFFWQTGWFIGLMILAFAAILVEITRWRTRLNAERLSLRFQERAAERERIAYQIHDTVIQDMIGTALQLELLGFQIADQPETASNSLDSLARRLRETIARSRNMVGSLHSTAVVQYSLVEVLRHAEAEFRLAELPTFELISEGRARPIHPLVRDEVYRICREALANAFRHANAQSVNVIVRFMPEALVVEITDDGVGMDDETRLHGRPGHFGLPGMQAHALRIGANVSIMSSLGQGTRIRLRVKTQRERWKWRRRKDDVEEQGTE